MKDRKETAAPTWLYGVGLGACGYGVLGILLMGLDVFLPRQPTQWGWILTFMLLFAFVAGVGFWRSGPIAVRMKLWMGAVSCVAVLATWRGGITLGPLSSWLVLLVFAGLLYGRRAASVTFALALAYNAIVAFLYYDGFLNYDILPTYDVREPRTAITSLLIFAATASLLSAGAVSIRNLLED